MKDVTITKEMVKEILKSAGGTILSVVFKKKNGDMRKLNGRLEVKKFLKGGDNSVAHIQKYITIFDLQNEGYRNVNVETVEEMSVGGQHYIVEG